MLIKGFFRLLSRCFKLAAPYGRRRLAFVLAVIFVNGLFQVVGVTSVFPFFALAAQPDRIRHSRVGEWLLGHLPAMSQNTLLVWAGIASIVLLFISNAVTLAGEVVRTRYGYGLGHSLRTRIMHGMSARPYSYFLERNSGALLQKVVGDVLQFVTGVFLPLMDALSRMVTLVFLLLTVFYVQPAIAIGAAVLLGGSYSVIFFLLRHRSHQLGEGIKRTNRGIMVTAQQFLGGIKPILVHEKTKYFTEEFTRHSAEQARLYPWVPIYSNTPRYLIEPLAYGGLVAAVVWLAMRGRAFSDILPNLTVMALAGYRMLPSIQLLYGQLNQVNAMRYTVGEIESELEEMAPVADRGSRSESAQTSSRIQMERTHVRCHEGHAEDRADLETSAPLLFEKVIRLENITFHYRGSKQPVLRDFSLEVPKNKSIGIVGVTGSGKSTLVDIILGLHQPQSGTIRVDNRVLTPEDMPSWRSLIGYVPQDIYLLDASVAANIAFGVPPEAINADRLGEAAQAAQILEFIEQDLRAKWNTVVGERGVRLSGGQRQRIGLARALYHQPQILILDEATSALDHKTEAEVMNAIYSLHGRLTMIIIAHRLTTIEHCDSIIKLHGGAKALSGANA